MGKCEKGIFILKNLNLRSNSGHWVSATNEEGEMNWALEDKPLWGTLWAINRLNNVAAVVILL